MSESEFISLCDLLMAQGRIAELDGLASEFLARVPDSPHGWFNLGNARLLADRPADAIEAYQRALALDPTHTRAYLNLGTAWQTVGRFDEALQCFDQAVALEPSHTPAVYNRANALLAARRFTEAAEGFRHALALDPKMSEARTNLGCALFGLGRYAEAETEHGRALALHPNSPEALNGRAISRFNQARLEGIFEDYDRAIALRPNFADARKNRALAYLLAGDEALGWSEYLWRWRATDAPRPAPAGPHWDGRPLDGTLLLLTEQGFGDVLQFVRYAEPARARVGRIVLTAPGRLLPLLKNARGVDEVVAFEDATNLPIQGCAPLMDLPHVLGIESGQRVAVPYLAAEPARVEAWSARLNALEGVRVGIAWQGSAGYHADQHRSLPLSVFEPLAQVPGVRLVSLQRGPGSEQVAELAGRFDVVELGPDLDRDGAFLDTAAVMPALDLVVSCDSAIAHLAGALARPVWIPLSVACDWRWRLDRDDSPWYPSVRLFRQTRLDDWSDVFMRMASLLARHETSR